MLVFENFLLNFLVMFSIFIEPVYSLVVNVIFILMQQFSNVWMVFSTEKSKCLFLLFPGKAGQFFIWEGWVIGELLAAFGGIRVMHEFDPSEYLYRFSLLPPFCPPHSF